MAQNGVVDQVQVTPELESISNLPFAEGDTLNLDALLPDDINSDTLGDYVSVAQQGNDAVLSIHSDAGLSTLTLEAVNLSAFGNANELVEQGWLTY